MAKTKTVETYQVGDMQVEFTRIPPETFRDGVSTKEKTRYEVRVDGVYLGYVIRPNGWGKQQLQVFRLGDAYDDKITGNMVYGGRYSQAIYQTADLAPVIVKLRTDDLRFGSHSLMTLDERAVYLEKLAQYEAEREAEDAAKRVRWDEEHRARVAAAEQKRQDILDALTSIRDRLSGDLTNFETAALVEAIAHYSKGK